MYKRKIFWGFCEKSHPAKGCFFLYKTYNPYNFANMLISLKLDTLSYKFLKRKNLLNLTCDESKDDYIGTVIFAMFLEFEQERRPLTDLLVRRYDDTYYHSASINISARKLRRTSRREMHYDTIRRANKFIHKQFLFEYLAHMRVTRYKYLEHKEDATYEFLKLYDLDENDVKVESLLRLWSRKRHQYAM